MSEIKTGSEDTGESEAAPGSPRVAFHPSVFIIEEMEARGWDRDMLAMQMVGGNAGDYGVTRLALDFYLDVGPDHSDMRIGDKSARQFAQAFDVSPELFLNLERAWLEFQSQPSPPR